jgi:hypothetical protein
LLFLALAFSSSTAAAQRTPEPVFTELFSYDPAAPSELLRKWRISSQLDSKLRPLRVGVVEDPIGKTVGRVSLMRDRRARRRTRRAGDYGPIIYKGAEMRGGVCRR